MQDILLIVFGWLLGLLAPAIVNSIKDRRESGVIKSALRSEIGELRYRLLLDVYKIESKHIGLDRKFFEWAQPIVMSYKGVNPSEELLNNIDQLLKLDQEQMSQYSQLIMSKRRADSRILLRKRYVPLLESNMTMLAKLDPVSMGKLLEIKARIGSLNEMRDDSRYYYNLSFESGLSQNNYKIADLNMIDTLKFYASQAREVIKIMGEFLDN